MRMGVSDEEARKESAREFRDVLIEESAKTGLDRIPGTAFDYTLALPQHLRNGYEWLWSLAGATPHYWTPTDTHKADFSSVYNSDTKFDDTVGTAVHSIVDSTKATGDMLYTLLKKPFEVGAKQGLKHAIRVHTARQAAKKMREEQSKRIQEEFEKQEWNNYLENAKRPIGLGNEAYNQKLNGLRNYEKTLTAELNAGGSRKHIADVVKRLQEVKDEIAKLEAIQY